MSTCILVVDDDDAHRGMLRTMLRSWGYAVEEATDGDEAVDLVREKSFDAVLTDDAALAERLRALRQYGWTRKYEVTVTGGANSRLDELQAALLLEMLPELDSWNARRRAIVADRMGLDVWEVIRLANRHPRVNILQPGPGVGGHCIAVDPWFIVHGAPEQTPLIRTARGVNDGKIHHVIARAEELLAAHPQLTVACLGLAFKANIDDFRESPARLVAATLARRHGARIKVVEPYAAQLPREFDGTAAELIDIDTALETAEILIVLVDHDQFRAVPLAERAGKLVYDTRGIWLDQPKLGEQAPVAGLRLAS